MADITVVCDPAYESSIINIDVVGLAESTLTLATEESRRIKDGDALQLRWSDVHRIRVDWNRALSTEDANPLADGVWQALPAFLLISVSNGDREVHESQSELETHSPHPVMLLFEEQSGTHTVSLDTTRWSANERLVVKRARTLPWRGPRPISEELIEVGSSPTYLPRTVREVFLVTNRKLQPHRGGRRPGREKSHELAFGRCHTSEASGASAAISLQEPDWVDQSDWIEICRSRLRALGVEAPIVIFIHGFANTWDDAVRRAAVLEGALGPALTIAFSWPSYGAWGPLSYLRDSNIADASANQIEKLLETISESFTDRKVLVVCHSMGSRAFFNASLSDPPKRTVRQTALIAPDIWEAEYESGVSRFSQRTTQHHVYGCWRDIALIVSGWARIKERMIGRLPPATASGPTTQIDIGARSGIDILAHSFAFDDGQILMDLRQALILERDPTQRQHLTPHPTHPEIWRLE